MVASSPCPRPETPRETLSQRRDEGTVAAAGFSAFTSEGAPPAVCGISTPSWSLKESTNTPGVQELDVEGFLLSLSLFPPEQGSQDDAPGGASVWI